MCPGSRTKVSVPLVLPQNRHPERSASPIDRLTQSLWRGVEGPRRCLFTHAVRSFPTTKPAAGGARRGLHETSAYRSRFYCRASPVEKLQTAWGKISIAEVLRLRPTSSVSGDQSVRRFAQDDDSVGELTERSTLCDRSGGTCSFTFGHSGSPPGASGALLLDLRNDTVQYRYEDYRGWHD